MKEFLADLVVKPLRPLDVVAEELTFFPGPMVAIRALKASNLQPQSHRAIQNGQIADASVSAFLDPRTASLTTRADEIRLSAFKLQLQLVWLEDLADHSESWQFE
jgi:hypothetical protein